MNPPLILAWNSVKGVGGVGGVRDSPHKKTLHQIEDESSDIWLHYMPRISYS